MPEVATKQAGWTTVAFGDVVQLSNERSGDPEADGFESFVGLEHIEPGDLHIRRWGDIANGITFTNVFRPGHVLFGKRRAYQRKVAVADFSGVCSSDIYVLEPKGNDLLPELLPFICQTDAFFEHAVGTSAGSLSPRTNWKSLADFEFSLPPIEEQRRLVEVFQSFETLRASYVRAESELAACRKAALNGAFAPSGSDSSRQEIQDIELPPGWRLVEAKTLSTAPITKGETPPGELKQGNGDIPFIKIYNLNFDGTLNYSIEPTFVSTKAHLGKLKRSCVIPGDILMNLVGPPLGKIALVTSEYPEWNINQAIARYRPMTPILGRYLWYYLQSDWARSWLERRSKKTSGQRNLTLQLAQDLPVPIPTSGEDIRLVSQRIDLIDDTRRRLLNRLAITNSLRKLISWRYLEMQR